MADAAAPALAGAAAAVMPCSRCNGLLVAADLFDGIGGATATRCTSCGDMFDAVILEHRRCWREPYSDATLPKFDPVQHPYAFGADAPGADSDPAAIEEFLGSGT